MMSRRIFPSLLLSSLLSATLALPAPAQISGPAARDSVTADSSATEQPRHNWFVSLIRKIARRSDDTPVAEAGTTTVAAVEAASARPVTAYVFKSTKDSVAWEAARTRATKSSGFRIIVSLLDRQLRVLDGDDTLRVATVATAMNSSLSYGGKTWRFVTPRGVRTVLRKEKDPVWTPPEWHFAEVALEHGLKLRELSMGQRVKLQDGTILTTRGDEVGIIRPGETEFLPLVLDEHIVFDNTLWIPPLGTKHRKVAGELGPFRLDLGEGYMLHGTPYKKSIGAAVTHGCVRMTDADIEWLYENVPVGTKVYIY